MKYLNEQSQETQVQSDMSMTDSRDLKSLCDKRLVAAKLGVWAGGMGDGGQKARAPGGKTSQSWAVTNSTVAVVTTALRTGELLRADLTSSRHKKNNCTVTEVN